ncbi:MAG: guanylate kinase [Thermodesulfobacteriaceae bacterium]|nr:guanylate kinase [Thermodesulfobacteriaceae bacterium]MCX8041595.1 guanylate kinase [Thermodesulfobacteriaceae bacterium]MDW8136553.1 guanylate kinase [Thermodesulfobacterium sp.]
MENLIFIISGPSGVGKSSLVKKLPLRDFYFSVSHTTRTPRPGEVNGKDYYFVEEKAFLKMIEKGEFLEWVRVYQTYYGTAKSEIEKAFSQKKHLILDIEVIGATRLRSYFGKEAIFIFVVPPSLEELKRRLKIRGTETEERIEERLNRAKEELRFASWFDYVIINEDLEKAYQSLQAIIEAELNRPFRNSLFKKLLSQII